MGVVVRRWRLLVVEIARIGGEIVGRLGVEVSPGCVVVGVGAKGLVGAVETILVVGGGAQGARAVLLVV